jgi:hypothetical protein
LPTNSVDQAQRGVDAQGLTDFTTVQSYADTAVKCRHDKLDALHQLFTTGAWLPPPCRPSRIATF